MRTMIECAGFLGAECHSLVVEAGVNGLVGRARAEFLEMPGLHLTAAQAGRLWNLDMETCSVVLRILLDDHFLARTPAGTYHRLESA